MGSGVAVLDYDGDGRPDLLFVNSCPWPGATAVPGSPPTLARTLRSTNTIESMIGICREHSKNVKRWRDGTMALRWCAAGMVEADHQFRRVNGHLHLPKLRSALDAHFRNVTAVSQNEDQKAA